MVSVLCAFGDPNLNPRGPEDAETAARELLLIAIIGQHSGFNQCVRFQPASLPLPTNSWRCSPRQGTPKPVILTRYIIFVEWSENSAKDESQYSIIVVQGNKAEHVPLTTMDCPCRLAEISVVRSLVQQASK